MPNGRGTRGGGRQEDSGFVPMLPTKFLPAAEIRDLPEPPAKIWPSSLIRPPMRPDLKPLRNGKTTPCLMPFTSSTKTREMFEWLWSATKSCLLKGPNFPWLRSQTMNEDELPIFPCTM